MRKTFLFISLALLAGCGTRGGEETTPPKKTEPTKEADNTAPPRVTSDPKPKDYGEYVAWLKSEVPIEVAALKKDKRWIVLSYDLSPNDSELFQSVTIQFKKVYLSDNLIAPKWFTKAILTRRTGNLTASPTTQQQAIQQAQLAALSGSTEWNSVTLLP
jgi:hypothetical protein